MKPTNIAAEELEARLRKKAELEQLYKDAEAEHALLADGDPAKKKLEGKMIEIGMGLAALQG